jgi:hypothetical protein
MPNSLSQPLPSLDTIHDHDNHHSEYESRTVGSTHQDAIIMTPMDASLSEAEIVEQELLPTSRRRQIIVLLSSFMAVFQTIGAKFRRCSEHRSLAK